MLYIQSPHHTTKARTYFYVSIHIQIVKYYETWSRHMNRKLELCGLHVLHVYGIERFYLQFQIHASRRIIQPSMNAAPH